MEIGTNFRAMRLRTGVGHIPKVVLVMAFLGTIFLAIRLLNFWKLHLRFTEALSPVHLKPLNPSAPLN